MNSRHQRDLALAKEIQGEHKHFKAYSDAFAEFNSNGHLAKAFENIERLYQRTATTHSDVLNVIVTLNDINQSTKLKNSEKGTLINTSIDARILPMLSR